MTTHDLSLESMTRVFNRVARSGFERKTTSYVLDGVDFVALT